MNALMNLFVLVCALTHMATACDLYDTDTAVCAKDLDEICGVNSFPDSIQSLYDSRNCLRKNREFVSKDCLDYIELDKPSIVDSCFIEMKSYCYNVSPGGFRVHSCLSAVPKEDLSLNCQSALAYDEKIIQEKGSAEHQISADFWNTWANYVTRITREISDTQKMMLSPFFQPNSVSGTHLRGSWFSLQQDLSEEEGVANQDGDSTDDTEDTVRAADDDSINGVESPITDDEVDDDEALGELKSQIFAAAGASTRLRDVTEDATENEPEAHGSVSSEQLVISLERK